MPPGDAACREMTAEEARRLADAWTALVPETARVDAGARRVSGAEEARRRLVFLLETPPARRDARAVRAVVRLRQVHRRAARRAGPDVQLRRGPNARVQVRFPRAERPRASRYEVIRKGLAQSGSTTARRRAYLDARAASR